MVTKFSQVKVGDVVEMVTLLTEIAAKKTKKGSDYLNLGLSDGEQTIHANLWNTERDKFPFEKGKILMLTLKADEYNGRLSYVVDSYGEAPESFSSTDFVKKVPIDLENTFEALMDHLDKFDDKKLANFVKVIYEDNKDKLLYWSAAKSVHHNCYGGLLYHVIRMIIAANVIAKVYKNVINKDLLIAATMLHDIGKLEELSTNELGVADYTVKGNLLGHPVLGIKLLESYAQKVNLEEETLMLLEHCIASHHGQVDWGAITIPAIPEACALSFIDNLDARMWIFEEQLKLLDEGQLSERIFGLDQRVYKPVKH